MPSHETVLTGFLLPADIEVAQRAFDRVCAMRGIEVSSDEAADQAATVIAFFQQGVTDEDRLVAEVCALAGSGRAVAA